MEVEQPGMKDLIKEYEDVFTGIGLPSCMSVKTT